MALWEQEGEEDGALAGEAENDTRPGETETDASNQCSRCEHGQADAAGQTTDRPDTPATDPDGKDSESGEEQMEHREEVAEREVEQGRKGIMERARKEERGAGRRRTDTTQMNKAGMIMCVEGHKSVDTKMAQSGGDRRTYKCGQCRRRFMQQDPGTIRDVITLCLHRDSPAAHALDAAKRTQQERKGEEPFPGHLDAISCLTGEDTTRV